jgi:hypothetical protein
MNLWELLAHAQSLKGIQQTSVHTHLEKLLKSHDYTDNNRDASEFFTYVVQDPNDFFAAENMPKEWSKRTYSSSMESLEHLVKHEEVKKVLSFIMEDEYEKLIKVIIARKKQYMNESKKEKRLLNKQQPPPKQPKDDTPPNTPASSDDSSDSPDVSGSPDTPDQSPKPEQESEKNNNCHGSIDKAIWMLERYIESEKDEFKLIILDLINHELKQVQAEHQ